jgi:outer membrane protein assembly factor BamB
VCIACLLSTLPAAPASQPAASSASAAPAAPVRATADWPGWRGPNHNGITASPRKWVTTWPADGLKKLWTTKIGQGYSSPVIVGDRVFIGGYGDPKKINKKDKEWDTLYCLSATTGEILWQMPMAIDGKSVLTAGTPVVDGEAVYVVSNAGDVCAFEAATGKELWNFDMTQEGVKTIEHRCWSSAPLLEGNLLVLNGGTDGIALDKSTGKVAWKSDSDTAPYMSPIPVDVDGQHLVLMVTGTKIVAVNPADGKVVFGSTKKEIGWQVTSQDLWADPVAQGNEFEFAGILLSLKDGKIAKAGGGKRNLELGSTGEPIVYKGCIYASHAYKSFNSKLDEYGYRCRDWATGEIKWEQKGICGQQIIVDDKLVILGIDGRLVIAQASPDKYVELARASIFTGYKDGQRDENQCMVAPAFADGRLYLRHKDTLVCLDLRE